jgi:hypothetical protein
MLPKPTEAPTAAIMNVLRLDHRSRSTEVSATQSVGVSISLIGDNLRDECMVNGMEIEEGECCLVST